MKEHTRKTDNRHASHPTHSFAHTHIYIVGNCLFPAFAGACTHEARISRIDLCGWWCGEECDKRQRSLSVYGYCIVMCVCVCECVGVACYRKWIRLIGVSCTAGGFTRAPHVNESHSWRWRTSAQSTVQLMGTHSRTQHARARALEPESCESNAKPRRQKRAFLFGFVLVFFSLSHSVGPLRDAVARFTHIIFRTHEQHTIGYEFARNLDRIWRDA